MALTDISALPNGRVLVATAPIIYLLEDDVVFASRFAPFFERAEAGGHELVISTVTLAEVLTGPLRAGNERLAERYRGVLTTPPTWRLVELTAAIAHRAAWIRARSRLRLPDAVQVATALETSSIGLVTHDRDFSSLDSLPERVVVYS